MWLRRLMKGFFINGSDGHRFLGILCAMTSAGATANSAKNSDSAIKLQAFVPTSNRSASSLAIGIRKRTLAHFCLLKSSRRICYDTEHKNSIKSSRRPLCKTHEIEPRNTQTTRKLGAAPQETM